MGTGFLTPGIESALEHPSRDGGLGGGGRAGALAGAVAGALTS